MFFFTGFSVHGLHKGMVHHKSMIQGLNDKWRIINNYTYFYYNWGTGLELWIDRKTQRENSRNGLQEGKLYYTEEKNYSNNEDEFRDGLRELLGKQRPNS